MKRFICWGLMVLFLSGCIVKPKMNFHVGEVKRATVGSPMLHVEFPAKLGAYWSWMTEQIVYLGHVKGVLRLGSRSYADNVVRDAFDEEFTFDVSETNVIAIGNTEIEIIEFEKNGAIIYKVIKTSFKEKYPDAEYIESSSY